MPTKLPDLPSGSPAVRADALPDSPTGKSGPVSEFIFRHFRHFNAAVVVEAIEAYRKLMDDDGKMFLTLAGAASTGEIGISLAEMIRQNKVHAIACTGANLEEDIFNLVGHSKYVRLPQYRTLTAEDEEKLLDEELSRVTDTAIPERYAMNRISAIVSKYWHDADRRGERMFPHEFLYAMIQDGELDELHEIDPKDSWMLAAAKKNLPIFVPGWEDSTLGNMYAAECFEGRVMNVETVRGGIDYMLELLNWYKVNAKGAGIGFFQLGGGIAGDFPICCVPLWRADLKKQVPHWSYFCQISDAPTSYGGYSGAEPTEKVTWDKINAETPRFVIESDFTIVWPLVAAGVLGL